MKLLLAVLTLALSTSVMAAPAKKQPKKSQEQKVCSALEDQVSEDCSHLMCDDMIADGTFKDMEDCVTASDYGEAAQATCEELPTVEDLVAEYNKKHNTNFTCE